MRGSSIPNKCKQNPKARRTKSGMSEFWFWFWSLIGKWGSPCQTALRKRFWEKTWKKLYLLTWQIIVEMKWNTTGFLSHSFSKVGVGVRTCQLVTEAQLTRSQRILKTSSSCFKVYQHVMHAWWVVDWIGVTRNAIGHGNWSVSRLFSNF